MTLGGITLPKTTEMSSASLKIGESRRTAGGTLKRDIKAIKQTFTLCFPNIRCTEFYPIKQLYDSKENITFVYPNENGIGDISVLVAINDMSYSKIDYVTPALTSNLVLSMEEI